jgi:hypothetical protein
MEALSGTSFGQNKETLLTTYNRFGCPLIEYGVFIWQPNISPTSNLKLQQTKNLALRIATGAHQRASIDHLHAETKVLKVDQNINLLASQFLANAF